MDDHNPKLGTSVRITEYYVCRAFTGITGLARSETGGDEGADKILDYYRASKGAFLCIQKNKRILHYGYIIKQSL